MTASQSLQHLVSEAELKNNAKRRSSRIPQGLSAKTYQQAPIDESVDGEDARNLGSVRRAARG